MCTYTYVHAYMQPCTCTHRHTHIYAHMQVHSCTRTHIHTRITWSGRSGFTYLLNKWFLNVFIWRTFFLKPMNVADLNIFWIVCLENILFARAPVIEWNGIVMRSKENQIFILYYFFQHKLLKQTTILFSSIENENWNNSIFEMGLIIVGWCNSQYICTNYSRFVRILVSWFKLQSV